MDDPDSVVADHEKRCSEESNVMRHPAMVVGEIVPNDVSCDSDDEGEKDAERSADGMGNKRLENFAIAARKHFERGRAQKIKCDENDEARRNAEDKAFDRVVSERAEVESAEKIAGIGTNTAGDKSWKGEIAWTKALKGKDGSGVS
jgi:hypothetical protein